MFKCSGCGKELPDGTKFCTYCGAEAVSKKSKVIEATNDSTSSSDEDTNTLDLSTKDIKDVLVDPTEKVIATYGNNYLQNLAISSGLENFAYILTNERLYYKGIGYYISGGSKVGLKAVTEKIVNLEDITGTEYVVISSLNTILLIIGIILTALGLGGMILSPMILIVAIVGLVMLCKVLFDATIRKQTYFVITFMGGKIEADIKIFGLASARDFCKQVVRAKDKKKKKS